ncbi:MAG: 2-oxoacid:acceptor oxidoreductase family protein [Candidatus Nanoarchaeia archaeon]|nr:2-oxoacid:acceptor oxidoreductase family protein [Candidatus Nanoarchaeia archaeon]MDD5740638.1 2-oxoacid:acceptor oxidoreductase family protein [Candidatus Nanoarchaeia archaeon]
MKLNILIGGKAGQGINAVSSIVSAVLSKQGYFTFNYRDYPSLIRGGHNFNVLSVSDEKIGSVESRLDGIIAMDENTIKKHKNELKKNGFMIESEKFENLGRNLNIALAGALIKILGIDKQPLIDEVNRFGEEAIKAAEKGFSSEKEKFKLKKLNKNIVIMTGSQGVAQGAVNSGIDIYFGYPMTPATPVLHELASLQEKNKFIVFLSENEIAAVNSAIGASFSGAKSMTGTSGGGFDLMTEALSLQGQTEIPLVVYLASRPGPSTGVPTYSMQDDLDVALRAGHGEFPRIVIAPGDAIECIEKTNESFYLSQKFNALSMILSDKHLAEGEFASDRKPNKTLKVEIKRKVPGEAIVKTNSYEHDEKGNTTEEAEIIKQKAEKRLKKYEEIKKECRRFQMIKIYGNKNAKNLIIGWGSTKTTILDAIDSIDSGIKTGKGNYKFLQVLYLKPLSDEIRKEIEKTEKAKGKVILIENNLTGQLGRLIREKTGISIKNRILKYDGRPFFVDELKEEIQKIK